jgi:hypothetical protein
MVGQREQLAVHACEKSRESARALYYRQLGFVVYFFSFSQILQQQ